MVCNMHAERNSQPHYILLSWNAKDGSPKEGPKLSATSMLVLGQNILLDTLPAQHGEPGMLHRSQIHIMM